jgi:hypothetical protein
VGGEIMPAAAEPAGSGGKMDRLFDFTGKAGLVNTMAARLSERPSTRHRPAERR